MRTALALRYEVTTEKVIPEVLLVEHDAAFRSAVTAALRQDGYHVSEASNRIETLSHLSGPRPLPDLIVVEAHLPVCSGLDLLAELRAHHWATPVVVLDRHGTDHVYEEADRLGATTVVEAPVSVEYLRCVVAAIVEE